MGAHDHNWRGQTTHDEWGHHRPLSVFVCASCGATWHPRSPVTWGSACSGTGESHRQRYAELPAKRRGALPPRTGPVLLLPEAGRKPRPR